MALHLRRLAAPSLRSCTPLAHLHRGSEIARHAPVSFACRSASSAIIPDAGADGPSDLPTLRRQAIKLYKELHRLGRDYPDPEYKFNERMRRAFEKNAKTTDPAIIKKQLELGEHIKKEVLALVSLKKFRHLRRSYYPNDPPR